MSVKKLKKGDMYLQLAAAIILLGAFLFPVWQIDLEAPQYPEGIGMQIWINKINGVNEHDLNNINKLNHYIGMKEIVPEAIPELTIFPYILLFLSIFGITAALFRSKTLILVWMILIVIFMAVSLYDFYTWGYEYGHNLNPNAPIKVPGMTYQPPLIGSKQLLNITSISLPAAGSLFIGVSFLVGLFILIKNKIPGKS